MREMSFRDDILPFVEKPGRYVGGEVNASRRRPSERTLNVVLAFPDTYEVGMSHVGLQILYGLLRENPAIVPERVFAPWPDMERRMRKKGLPLVSLESGTPLHRFDVVGFSLQYELSYTNVLAMLDLGGIPLFAKDRHGEVPLVIAGGPSAFNPLPTAPFVDAFVIGEGEEALLEITGLLGAMKGTKARRGEKLRRLGDIEGVYVPRFHGREKTIRKRVLANLAAWREPRKPVVPVIRTVHDRVTLEIARGCTRGCRFCQAGMVWRPVRERSAATILDMADAMIGATGGDEISLLSLSSGDYTAIGDLMGTLMDRCVREKVALALPSLRVETLTDRLIQEIRRVRKTSFTLAPEAGTRRLREVINKGNREEDLLKTASAVFDAGWRSLKLYFMMGLPTETREDLEGIADLAFKVLREGGFRRQVTVSLSTFVPKPHTPFQWARQLTTGEIRERQDFFRKRMGHRNVNLRWHDGSMSLLEGLLSRGDESLGALVHEVFRRGCRMDGWGEQFSFAPWESAMADLGIVPERLLDERDRDAPLPWDFVDAGVHRAFLAAEYEKALRGEETADCRTGPCTGCGACTKEIGIVLEKKHPGMPEDRSPSPAPVESRQDSRRYRVRFAKKTEGRFLSHLETAAALVRAFRKARVPFRFSEGYHPQPRISFTDATPVGMESFCEYAELSLRAPLAPGDVLAAVNDGLPAGLEVLSIEEAGPGTPSLGASIGGYVYFVDLTPALTLTPEETEGRIQEFMKKASVKTWKNRKGKNREQDLRAPVRLFTRNGPGNDLRMEMTFLEGGTRNPLDVVTHVFGLEEEAARAVRIVKEEALFSRREEGHV